MLEKSSLKLLAEALEKLDRGFERLPPTKDEEYDEWAAAQVMSAVAERLQDNYPYFHPLYAGQMLKPPHPVARAAYGLAQWINPNNHALDGGRASSEMEKEAVAELAAMVGWKTHLGHLTSGGTVANLEALWVAGKLEPGKAIVGSEQAHYTHQRISGVLGLKFEAIATDGRGRMDAGALAKRLASGDVGTVVATMGTTATGSVDPLDEIVELKRKYKFRVHADAAYGGYFKLAMNLGEDTARALDCMPLVDSVVIDPHKHGLQPYGCGCVQFADPAVGRLYKHDSPYTYFSSSELHLGEISLECSRAGATAVALWATQKLLPLVEDGEFAVRLDKSRSAALKLFHRLEQGGRFVMAFEPELDIVVFAPRGGSVSEISERTRRIFAAAAEQGLHLAVARLPVGFFAGNLGEAKRDAEIVTCLRSVLMKPEHLEWVDRIGELIEAAEEAERSGPRPAAGS